MVHPGGSDTELNPEDTWLGIEERSVQPELGREVCGCMVVSPGAGACTLVMSVNFF